MKREEYLEKYNAATHILGRIASLVTLILLLGAPFLIGSILGALPDLSAAFKGFLSVGIIWTVSSVVEFLVYLPAHVVREIHGLFPQYLGDLL